MSDVLSSLQKLQLQELDPTDFNCIVNPEIGELGCGLHSSVRMADHRTFGWVAIKCFIITGGAPQKRRLEKKLKKELQVLQQAMNNHIVRIFGWVKRPGSMGLVMEYMPGGNLGQFIGDDSDKLPLKVVLRIGCETSDGIAFMHNLPTDQRVVHGDLKPENVLLSPDLHCKLGDFGCAQLIALTGSTITSSGRPDKTDLTLAYAAPEKLEDFNTPAKKEQDTYSFGMLLYALLRGSPPYQHRSQESAFIELIKRGDRPKTRPIEELKETLNNNEDNKILETLQSIIEKCWQQAPSDRPTMIEVRDELQRLLRLQNDADILKEVTEVVDTLSISIPNADEHQLLPLHFFSPIRGTFVQGNVRNVYNMPDVRQAAIECGTVEFQHAETGTNAAEQQERQQIATTEADDLRSSAEASRKRSLKVDKIPISAHKKARPTSSIAANAAEQQERQQIATTEADDLRSNAEASRKRSLKVDKIPISTHKKARPTSSIAVNAGQDVEHSRRDTSDSGSGSRVSCLRSSFGDGETTASSSKSVDMDLKLLSGRKPTLSEVFESSDPSVLSSNVQPAPSLLEIYKVLLKDQNYEETKTMATKITSMIEDNVDATAKEVEEFGIKLREKKLFLESIAFFDAAFAMFEKMGKTEECLKRMTGCVWEIMQTNRAIIGDDTSMKGIVKNCFISLMREKLRHIEDTSSANEQFKCLQVCEVLNFIEVSEYLVDEWKEREKTLRFALTRMKDLFKSDVMNYKLYGGLLHNLGVVCERASRFEEAAAIYKQAIDAKKAATDFNDEEQKKRSNELSEKNLKNVQRKIM